MLSNSRTIFNQVTKELTPIYGKEEADSLAFLLLESMAGLSKADILLEKSIDPLKLNTEINGVLKRLKKYEPLQYILGKADFYGIELLVNKSVLIPRQETEELVDWIIKAKHELTTILDIGTGSGCIAIALASYLSDVGVSAWDVSEEALKMAKENSRRQGTRVTFQQVDILGDVPVETFDLIVSNPPYIREKEKSSMLQNVLDYEPEKALFVSDQDPLLFYKAINRQSKKLLRSGGWLYYEINETFGREVVKSLEDQAFMDIEIRRDINGKDRMIRGRKP